MILKILFFKKIKIVVLKVRKMIFLKKYILKNFFGMLYTQ